jgi:uncharacterized membrane protein
VVVGGGWWWWLMLVVLAVMMIMVVVQITWTWRLVQQHEPDEKEELAPKTLRRVDIDSNQSRVRAVGR